MFTPSVCTNHKRSTQKNLGVSTQLENSLDDFENRKRACEGEPAEEDYSENGAALL